MTEPQEAESHELDTPIFRASVAAILKALTTHAEDPVKLEQVRGLTVAMTRCIQDFSESCPGDGITIMVAIHAVINVLTQQCAIAELPTDPMWEAMRLVSGNFTRWFDGGEEIPPDATPEQMEAMYRSREEIRAEDHWRATQPVREEP
jgi:hypothetical protein